MDLPLRTFRPPDRNSVLGSNILRPIQVQSLKNCPPEALEGRAAEYVIPK